tara:strand:+ start:3200 stop:3676 length:477 start_codon:yes stop_codon:yes gene_type:complete
MNKEQEKVLKQMIKENNTEDHTSTIMELKHSALIRHDVSVIQNIKRKTHSKDFSILDKEARSQNCGFLFQHYPNIYNKLLKDEIQIKILYRFLDELESIEKGKQNQHEAAYKIGLLLKEIYIDKKIDTIKEEPKEKPKIKKKNITYEEFKKQQYNNKN